MKEKIIFCWSTGKDSAMALYKLCRSGKYEISCILTTITEGYKRVGMHGVRRSLFRRQVQELGLPYEEVFIPKGTSNDIYEARMKAALTRHWALGVRSVAFGDIFLDDLRRYRLANLAKIGMDGIFPLWKRDTYDLADEFIGMGFKAIVTCIDSRVMGKEFCGREFDKNLLAKMPDKVDPCGENGEFHTFVFAGPLFRKKVDFEKGVTVLRENRFYYCDLKTR